jgi:hypothetical protein
MIELKERSEKTVRREVYEFDREFAGYSTWTRRTVDGDVVAWVPHDAYGELMDSFGNVSGSETFRELETTYQESEYS